MLTNVKINCGGININEQIDLTETYFERLKLSLGDELKRTTEPCSFSVWLKSWKAVNDIESLQQLIGEVILNDIFSIAVDDKNLEVVKQ